MKKKQQKIVPPEDLLSIAFLKLITQRFPSVDNVMKFSRIFGYENNVEAQIVLFSIFCGTVRQVSSELFFSLEHREEVLIVLMDTVEELEKILEEEEFAEMPQNKEGIIIP